MAPEIRRYFFGNATNSRILNLRFVEFGAFVF